jgi:hypothetical protein
MPTDDAVVFMYWIVRRCENGDGCQHCLAAIRAALAAAEARERERVDAVIGRAYVWYHHEARDTKDEAAAVHWFSIGQRCAAEEIRAAVRALPAHEPRDEGDRGDADGDDPGRGA